MIPSRRFCAALLAAAFACCAILVRLTWIGDQALALPRRTTQGQASGEALPLPPGASFQRRVLPGGGYDLAYGFINFNRDRLSAAFRITRAELEDSLKEFGWSGKAAEEIYRKTRGGEAQARRNVAEYMALRGFKLLPEKEVAPDVPLMVHRNARRVNGLAQVLAEEGERRGYSSEDVVGAATAMVQTALQYKTPPAIDHGLHTGGLYPPPRTLVYGWGDCDTKTALLGSVLANWSGMRLVGLSLPDHYLMGIGQIPRQADAYVEYDATQYVLIEPAGPAWLPPGTVGAHTQDQLEHMSEVPIEPF